MADRTIAALLALRRREDGDLRAVVGDGAAVTYRELDDASRALAARLIGAGAEKGHRVGLLMPNGVEWAVTALAITRIGAVLVPLSTLLRPPELLDHLRAADVTQLIAVPEFRGRHYLDELPAVPPSVRRVWTPERIPGDIPGGIPGDIPGNMVDLVDALDGAVRPADDLVILFTSGSRGRPKGTVHTHGSGLRAVASGLEDRCVRHEERLYLPMPFFWTGGFSGGLLSALVAGATLLTEAIPEPAGTLELLARERVTLFRGWPDQAARLAAHPGFADADLSQLRPASLGPVLPAVHRPAPGARANLFGMTETFGPYCGARLDVDLPAGKHGSCGKPFDGVDVRIVDPGTGAPMPRGEAGEIQVRGPNVLRGIWGRVDSFGADGFYPTRDLGRLDADGYLWYQGRLDDMVKVSGATVYPAEVEAALRALPGVAAAYVTDLDGEVAALVVGPAVQAGELTGLAKGRLSSFKVPTRWLVLPDAALVPQLASGKVDRTALRALLRAEGVPASR